MLTLAFTAFALAAPPPDLGQEPDRVMSLGLSLSPLIGTDVSGGGLGQATIQVHLPPVTLEILGAEGAMSGPTRTVGFIAVGLRKHIAYGTWARVLFAHHHETLWADFIDHPGASLAGVDSQITHRSGVDVGFGWERPIGGKLVGDRLVVDLGAFVRVFPGKVDPPVYVGLQIGVSGRVGPEWKRKHAPEP